MPHPLTNRAGIGLPIALAAVVIVSSIIAGASFAATQSYRLDSNALVQERALAAAEQGQARIVRDWSAAWNSKAVGDTLLRTYAFTDGSSASVVVTRLNVATFWVASDGAANQRVRQQNARRRTNLILRLNIPNLRIPGAISARDATRATGSGTMNGNDVNPLGWDCPATGAPAAAIAVDSLVDAGTAGTCAGGTCLTTTAPSPYAADTLLRDTTTYGSGMNWDEWKSLAGTSAGMTMDVSPGTGPHDGLSLNGIAPTYNADGSCKTNDYYNWGDINRNPVLPGKCEGHFPVIYLRGDGANSYATINGGTGQGILIVDGNLQINGTFTFYGPIIVRGNFKTNGTSTGVKITGGVMAGNFFCNSTPTTPCNDITGNTSIQFSRCAILTAAQKNAKVVQASRPWADLF
jgi:hypothetical protein